MYLATALVPTGSAGETTALVGDGRGWVALPYSDIGELVSTPDWHTSANAALAGDAARIHANELTFAPPILHPAKILCCGLNYRDHILETGREVPTHPTLFAKFADTLLAPYGDLHAAEHQKLDWEAELAIVIGTEIHRADRDEAEAAILGYAVSNDISMRDWQQRTLQWLQGKAFDETTPIGPWITTADTVDPIAGLAIECRVNGEAMQSSNTRELVFDAPALVAYVSSFTRLRPGDIILSGTPGGVALGMAEPRFLNDGDVVETRIEGLGELRNVVRFD